MNCTFFLLLLSSLLAAANSAVFYEKLLTIPGFESLCHDKEDNVFYKKGEEMKWNLESCGRKICRGLRGKEAYAEIQTCGKVHVPPRCSVVVDLNLSYPKCCQRVICPDRRRKRRVNMQNPYY